MNKLFFLIFVICAIYSVNCIKLENLCKDETFKYYETYESKIKIVNSFLRLSLTKKLNLKGEINIKNISDNELWSLEDKEQIRVFKSDYQRLVDEVLNERYINSIRRTSIVTFRGTLLKQRNTQIELVKKLNDVFLNIKKKGPSKETSRIFQVYKDQLQNLQDFLYYTEQIRIDQLHEKRILTLKELKSILNDLGTKLEDGQSFIIHLKNSKRYYYEMLFKMNKFTLGDGDSLSTMEYELFIPFNNQKYTEKGCTSKSDLTIFFKSG